MVTQKEKHIVDKNKRFFRLPFYVIMVLYFILGYSSLGYGEEWAARLFPEDHYFESVGAISLFVASVLSFYIFVRALNTRNITRIYRVRLLVYLGLAVLYFFGAGEEISWGQRIFHFGGPAELAQQNVQGELNIHNLAMFEKSKLLNADNIFTVFWFSFAVLIPAASLSWKGFRRFAGKLTPIIYWGIGLLLLLNYMGAKLAKLVYVSAYTYRLIPFVQAVQEIKESNYELVFVFLSLSVLWDLNRLIGERSESPRIPVQNQK